MHAYNMDMMCISCMYGIKQCAFLDSQYCLSSFFLRINTIYVCHVMSCVVFHSADIRARIQGAIRFQRLHVETESDRGAAQPVRRRLLRRHGGPSALLPVVLDTVVYEEGYVALLLAREFST